jgi:4-hydroxy-tetrahydrodipicolinate reductase
MERATPMRIVLVGYGKMGRMIESLAGEFGCEVAGVIDPMAPQGKDGPGSPRWSGVDVAIDFSTPDSVVKNVPALAGRGISVVIGTTGWQKDEAAIRQAVADTGVGIVSAPNFSTGVILFEAVVARAAALFSAHPEFGAWLNEAHHHTKKDAPSGTAIMLKQAMETAGYSRPIDVSSIRAGSIPGVHTVGFDGPADTITLTHTARDRSAFARGALLAATWVKGRRGWFNMHDVLGLDKVHWRETTEVRSNK